MQYLYKSCLYLSWFYVMVMGDTLGVSSRKWLAKGPVQVGTLSQNGSDLRGLVVGCPLLQFLSLVISLSLSLSLVLSLFSFCHTFFLFHEKKKGVQKYHYDAKNINWNLYAKNYDSFGYFVCVGSFEALKMCLIVFNSSTRLSGHKQTYHTYTRTHTLTHIHTHTFKESHSLSHSKNATHHTTHEYKDVTMIHLSLKSR